MEQKLKEDLVKYRIETPRSRWTEFKATIGKDVSNLNDVFQDMIKERIAKK
jgi:hypothetical protein